MNYFKTGFFGFILLFIHTTVIGQQSELPEGYIFNSGKHYQIKGVEYTYNDLRYTFREVPEFYKYSEKALRQSITSNVFGVIAVGFIGAGLLTIPSCEGFGCIVPALFIVSSFPFGTIGIITRITSIGNKKKSIQYLNEYQQRRESKSSLHIGATQHGVGLVIKF